MFKRFVLFIFIILALASLNAAQSTNITTASNNFSLLECSGVSYFSLPSTVVDISVKLTSKTSFASPITDTTASAKDIQNAIQNVESQVGESSNRLVSYLRTNYSQSLSKLKTSNVQLQPDYTYSTTQSKSLFTGYSSAVTVSFRIPISSSSTIIAELVMLGVNQINSIQYSATDDEIKRARLNAVELATNDAILQASSMVQSFNSDSYFNSTSLLHTLSVVKSSVDYLTPPNGESTSGPIYSGVAGAPDGSNAPTIPSTPLISSEQLIKATVTVQFTVQR